MSIVKQKAFYILDILKNTDEEHPLTVEQIRQKLSLEYAVEAERKSIGRDINMFKDDLGYDIILSSDSKKGYFMGDRKFDDWELKLLIDAVAAAKFLSQKDADQIISKLQAESSLAGRKTLKAIRPIKSRARSGKSNIRYQIADILQAIRNRKKISFNYVYLHGDMQEDMRHDGFAYVISPYLLYWQDEQYYLIGNYGKYDNLSNYRLDRIRNLSVCAEDYRPPEELLGANADLALEKHVQSSMYRFAGKKIVLYLFCQDSMQSAIADFFGADVRIKLVEGGFEAQIPTMETEGLIFWLMQHGAYVKVLAPESVKQSFKDFLAQTVKMNE